MNSAIITKHLPFLMLILLSSLITKAQSASIGVKSGLINSNFVSSSENSSRNAFCFGIITNFEIVKNKKVSKRYSIQTEINYCPEGSITKGLQPIPDLMYHTLNLSSNTVYYGLYKKETILNNMKIPLLARVTLPITGRFKYYILFGPYLSCLGKARIITSGTGSILENVNGQISDTHEAANTGISFDNTWDATSEFRKFHFGAEGGLGFSYGYPYSLTRIFIEARFGMNISNISKNKNDGLNISQESRIIAAGILLKL